MNELVDRLIRERRESGEDLTTKPDLLSYMLSGVDKRTGERLDDVDIRYQIITFLIAGHETTSGLLSFTLHFLLNRPDVLTRAYQEVDRILDTAPIPSVTRLCCVDRRRWHRRPTGPAGSDRPRDRCRPSCWWGRRSGAARRPRSSGRCR